MSGLAHAGGRFHITLDGDLQNPPEEIPALVTTLKEEPKLDVVVGIPKEKRRAFWRRFGLIDQAGDGQGGAGSCTVCINLLAFRPWRSSRGAEQPFGRGIQAIVAGYSP
jgi:hypothetical protein